MKGCVVSVTAPCVFKNEAHFSVEAKRLKAHGLNKGKRHFHLAGNGYCAVS